MADPTLKDVLAAVQKLVAKVDAMEAAMATKEQVEAHRTETRRGFADLDVELSEHTKLHREIERDIIALKKKTATPRAPARAARRR